MAISTIFITTRLGEEERDALFIDMVVGVWFWRRGVVNDVTVDEFFDG